MFCTKGHRFRGKGWVGPKNESSFANIGVHLELFGSETRVKITNPAKNLQAKYQKRIGPRDEFVAYPDAVGSLDEVSPTIIDFKTTTSSYPSSPDGIVSLDQQLISYSWITGIANVALVVFVRKK